MAIILPDLPYAYDALEPYIDAETMHLHHDKHHQTYVNNANAALEKHPEIGEDLEALLADVESIPADIRQALINNGGGHLNHALFWELMTPEKTGCLRYHFYIERKRGITDGYYLTRPSIRIRRLGTIYRC